MTATLTAQTLSDADVVARVGHLDTRDHGHGPLIGWVVCEVDPSGLGVHQVVLRVTGRANRKTVQRAALGMVRDGKVIDVHQVHRCGCITG